MLKTSFLVNGKPIRISISIGISVMSAEDTNTDDPLSRADMALYSAKERGRNRVEVAEALC
jgi:diguanylate cyclase (GGDEF)-like protein